MKIMNILEKRRPKSMVDRQINQLKWTYTALFTLLSILLLCIISFVILARYKPIWNSRILGYCQQVIDEYDYDKIGEASEELELILQKYDFCLIRCSEDCQTVTVYHDCLLHKGSDIAKLVTLAVNSAEYGGHLKRSNVFYLKEPIDDGYIIVFCDDSVLMSFSLRLLRVELKMAVPMLVIIFVLSAITAYFAANPVSNMLKKQERFIMDASHELKTPLTIILANNNILLEHSDDSIKSQLKWVESTDEEVKHMKALIEELLMMLRARTSGVADEKENIDLSRIVQQVCLHFDAVAYEKRISFEYRIADGIIINGNQKYLKQLIMILLDNAIKYEPGNGKVEVSLINLGSKAQLVVQNHSSVLEQESLPHIFETFYRSSGARSSNSGMGLGLPLAKSIVDAHYGTIKVKVFGSSGCEFIITLPKLRSEHDGLIV